MKTLLQTLMAHIADHWILWGAGAVVLALILIGWWTQPKDTTPPANHGE